MIGQQYCLDGLDGFYVYPRHARTRAREQVKPENRPIRPSRYRYEMWGCRQPPENLG